MAKKLENLIKRSSLQEKTITPTEAVQEVTADEGNDGLSKVTVEAIPDEYIQPSDTLSISENGTHDVAEYASAEVNVQPTLEEITITENGEYTPSGDGFSKVTVEVEPSEDVEEWDGTGTVTALVTDLVITIGTTTYSILPLMTWYEWVNSEYNTGGFACSADDSKVFLGDSQNYLLDSEGNPVYGNTAITTGGTYTISYATTILSSDSAKMVDAGGVMLTLKEN